MFADHSHGHGHGHGPAVSHVHGPGLSAGGAGAGAGGVGTSTGSSNTSSPRIAIRRRVHDGAGLDEGYDASGLPIHLSGASGGGGGGGGSKARRSALARGLYCLPANAGPVFVLLVAIGALTAGMFLGMVFFAGLEAPTMVPAQKAAPAPGAPAGSGAAAPVLSELQSRLKTQNSKIAELETELNRLRAAARVAQRVQPATQADPSHIRHDPAANAAQQGNRAEVAGAPKASGAVAKAAVDNHGDAHISQQDAMVRQAAVGDKTPTTEDKHADTSDVTPVYMWDKLPESSVWCYGNTRDDRICRFRNLCYHPDHEKWFILKTNRSVLSNVPEDRGEPLLDTGTVQNHPYFFWNYAEASPFAENLQNVPVRYEEMPHLLFKRLHPKNIMHNLHDDLLGMYFMVKQFVGGGSRRLPFSLNTHRVMIIDPHGFTESTRPFQYLSNHPIRFSSYLKQKGDEKVFTCFRDAVVGNTKLTTWYQYGFREPQGPILGKSPNGMYVREVSEWFLRRLAQPLSPDEDYTLPRTFTLPPGVSADKPSEMDKLVDYPETDLIVIMSRRRNRLILNEDELANDLHRAFGYEVKFVRNEDMTFEEQILAMRRARVVLAMHGSILVMTMFCRRGTVVIEMYPFAVPGDHYTPYKTLANLNGMDLVYRAWENKHASMSVGHPDNHRLNGGINHLPPEERELVLNTLTVPQHKCCSSPYWLYRIYQDTRVTTSEVVELITEALVESRQILKRVRTTDPDKADVHSIAPTNIRCLEHGNRPPGSLWLAWDPIWTGGQAERWNVHVANDGREYITLGSAPTIAIPRFEPNTTVRFFVRSIAGNVKGDWSTRHECVV
ncbi:Protein O-linked-mannose beta-1,4-N-acetylglucosaminyltransferase 2 [Polyrhizophydium stewartii]|uniref:Protein O-linked-mannose beta-1,4-N-acetylglucosaminyltransferase 2 n=1 Tax=Polyrhizophydium stewartii TaxID=2732419 RepID=A0ABR4MWY4_9FUNG|nr:Protein O-linked-mannose beta-1,4-N-acetylglucosaminyltransferase 2 [Polyrhizophydium stewartii]